MIRCGSGNPPGEVTRTAADDIVTFISWSAAAWDALGSVVESDKTLTFPVTCPGGGEMAVKGSQVTLSNCSVTSDNGTYTGSGTYTVSEQGTLVTHSWDQDLSASETNATVTFSSDGFITFDNSGSSVSFQFEATFSTGVHLMSGSLAENNDGTIDLSITLALDGVAWLNCSFDDVIVANLTEAEILTGCNI